MGFHNFFVRIAELMELTAGVVVAAIPVVSSNCSRTCRHSVRCLEFFVFRPSIISGNIFGGLTSSVTSWIIVRTGVRTESFASPN